MPEKSPLEYKVSVMGDSQSVDYGEWGKDCKMLHFGTCHRRI